MTKKFIKHIEDIATGSVNGSMAGVNDGLFYVMDAHRIIRLPDKIDIQCNQLSDYARKYICRKLFDTDNNDYKMVELPGADEIKKNISSLVGRKRDTVAFGCDDFAMNARYLMDVISVLKCKVCYVPANKYMPVLFYEDDDAAGITAEAIMRVNSNRIGYWIVT